MTRLDSDSDGSVSPAEIDAFSDEEWAEMARIEKELNDFLDRVGGKSRREEL